MAAPTTNEQLLALVRKSGLVEAGRLNAFLEEAEIRELPPDNPRKLGRRLIRHGLVTDFQAQQLLLGKSRGFHLGKYLVLEHLSSDGLFTSYLCEEPDQRTRVSVQIIPPEIRVDEVLREQSQRETETLARLNHPGLDVLSDVESDGQLHFLVGPYVEGAHWRRIVRNRGPLEPGYAAEYVRQAALILQHVHEAGLVHGGIQPRNFQVDAEGVVQLLNAGMAGFYQKLGPIEPPNDDYRAPEQLTPAATIDIRSDIYSLGATFHFLLTGCSIRELEEPTPLRLLRADVPEEMAAIAEKMTASDPAARFAVPGEIAKALTPWATSPMPPPTPEELPSLSPAATRTLPTPMLTIAASTPAARKLAQASEPEYILRDDKHPTQAKTPPTPKEEVKSPSTATPTDDERFRAVETDSQVELSLGTGAGDSEMDLLLIGSGGDSEFDLNIGGAGNDTDEELSLIDTSTEESPSSRPEKEKKPPPKPTSPARKDPAQDRTPHVASKESGSHASSLLTPASVPASATKGGADRPRSSAPQINPGFTRSSAKKTSSAKSGAAKKKPAKAADEQANSKTWLLVLVTIIVLIPVTHATYKMLAPMFAGSDSSAESTEPEKADQLEGTLEVVDGEKIYGHAWDRARPNRVVKVDIFDAGKLVATVQADIFRDDLRMRQMGNGKHSFSYKIPPEMRDGQEHMIRVMFSGTEKDLLDSPKTVILKK